tara:strand:+ start:16636 stop:17580 length:945 start_codon:yes stop_codon:yes gene_type:complete
MGDKSMNLLVTGCAGFIGSHAVEAFLMAGHTVIGVDKMTYAGKPENMKTFINKILFYKADISDCVQMQKIISDHNIDWVINFAAESHVDRSIDAADQFLHSNIGGVHSLLEACRKEGSRMFQISTDEVYGSTIDGSFVESAKLCPRNPYSATKAAAEHLVTSYYTTHGVEYKMVRMSNNFGPRQDKEKLIPKILKKLSDGQKIPIYGNGKNIRDWFYVEDCAKCILEVLDNGKPNKVYNLSLNNEKENLEVIRTILDLLDKDFDPSIEFVKDRLGHDFRYSIDASKFVNLNPSIKATNFKEALLRTIEYYEEKQ